MDTIEIEREGEGRCPECGQAHRPGAKFCSECGARLAVEPERESRKTVTAVFADLIGSTPLQERIDAETAHKVMDGFYQTMREVLEAHEGRVAKFIGDAVVAIFGVPAVREDDALRAVRAAAAMRQALGALNDQLERDWGVRIGMRIGVNTGEVVISAEGLAVGDAMNTAARLEQTAGADEILIGETTFRLVRHAVHCETVTPLTLKGKREPVPAHLLLDAPAEGQQRARMEAPLVGRDPELQRLLAVFEEAVRARACRLVTVVGSPGLGKTRLAEELASTLAERATVVQGRCEPAGEGITFLPVAEVLRGAAQIGEADDAGVVRSKLSALLPGDPDVDLLVERAGGVLGIAKPATAEETFWAVRRLLGGLARERPLIVVLDDVHWGQPTFLDLVEHLVEWGREAPILLVALARPELRELRPALSDPGGLATDVLELTPLTDEHCRRLVSELLDRTDVPEALASRLLQTTGGNPLFLGETLRMFVDDGVLRREGDEWVATVDAAAVQVPPTISALLAARIARLGPSERSVVERAAVIGKQFYRGAVADLAPASVAAGIDAHLHGLHRKEVIEPEGTLWIDEPVFRFHHVLIRDAAYRTLLKEARADLHERFADWLTDKAGALVGEHEEVIAFHLEQAFAYRCELGPVDDHGRALGDRAVALLHATGRRALEREDLPAATNLLGRAASLLRDEAPGGADVLIDLLEALLSAGQAGDAEAAAARLRGLAGHGERPGAWAAIATAQLAQLTDSTGLHATVADVARAGETLAAVGDDSGLAKAHHVRAQSLALLGQVAEVEAALDQALAAARRADDTRRATAVLSGAPRAALWGPSPVLRSSGRCLDVVRILRMTQGNRHVEAVALRCQAVLEAMRGRPEAARDILDRCRMTLEELGLTLELLETEQYAGIVELVAGDHAAAEARLRIAYDGFAARGLDVSTAAAAALLARALVEQGRDKEAFDLTVFCEEHGGESLKTTIAWCGVRARVLARRGDHGAAEVLAARAVAIADGTDALVDHGDARLDLAWVLREAGHEERAVAQAQRAAELFEAKGYESGAERAGRFAGEQGVQRAAPPVLPEPTQVGASGNAVAQLYARYCEMFNSRDWPRFATLFAEDFLFVNRLPVTPWEPVRGPAEAVAALPALLAMSDDLQAFVEFVEGDDEVAIMRYGHRGHATDGGGLLEDVAMAVVVVRDGQFVATETFDVDTDLAMLRARAAELRPLARRRPGVGLPDEPLPSEGWILRYLAEMDQAATTGETDVRREYELITASATRVAIRLDARGTMADGDGPFELHSFGLGEFRDGIGQAREYFDDEAALRARFTELESRAAPGPSGVIAELYTRVSDGFNARDWAAAEATMAEDFRMVERRPVTGWSPTVTRGELIATFQSLVEMSPDLQASFELIEGDDEVALVRWGWAGHAGDADGGGRFELQDLHVNVARDGRALRLEPYVVETDLEDLRARAQELRPLARRRPGVDLPTEPLPVEGYHLRYFAEADRASRTGDWEVWKQLVAAELTSVDHRFASTLGEVRGRDDFLAREMSLAASSHDRCTNYELIAASQTRSASRLAVQGRMADGGGPFELAVACLAEYRDGRVTRYELYEPDDEAAMLARFAELEGTEAPEPSGVIAELYTRVCGGFNSRDWGAVEAAMDKDFRSVERRPATGWSPALTRTDMMATFRSLLTMSGDLQLRFDVIEGDDEVAIVRFGGAGHASEADGGGLMETEVLHVFVARDGLALHIEVHVLETDLAVLRARAQDLRPLARRRPGASLPDEPLPVEGYGLRYFVEADRASRTGDWEGWKQLVAPELTSVDHRFASTLGEVCGRDDFLARVMSLAANSRDRRTRYELIAASPTRSATNFVVHGSMVDGDGPFELAVACLAEYRDGVVTRFELYEPDDEAAMLARFAELEGVAAPKPSNAIAEIYARVADAVNARDWEAAEAAMAEDFLVVERRLATGWPPTLTRSEMIATFQSVVAMSPDLQAFFELIEGDDEVAIVRWGWAGHADATDGGGQFELQDLHVHVARDGRALHIEPYVLETDLAVLRARAQELRPLTRRRPGIGLPAEPLATERWTLQLVTASDAAQRTADYGPLGSLLAPDLMMVDHRLVGMMGDVRDRDDYVAREVSMAAIARDLRRPFRLIAAGETCSAAVGSVLGTFIEGGGPFDLGWGCVAVWHDGVATRMEWFEPEDEAAMLARFAELEAAGSLEAIASAPVTEAVLNGVCDAFNARNWEAIESRCADDFLMVDRRLVSWSEIRGPGEMVETFRGFAAVIPDIHDQFECIHADDEVALVRWWWDGHAADEYGGGAMEDSFVLVFVVRDGVGVRNEAYPPDADLEVLRARCEEVRPLARRRPGVDLPDEPLPAEHHCLHYLVELDRASRTGDWERWTQLVAPDVTSVDHRFASTLGEVCGRDDLLAREMSGAASSRNRLSTYELIAASETRHAINVVVHGQLVDGDGPFELAVAVLGEYRDGLLAHLEFFELEDEAAMLARFVELEAGASSSPTAIERWYLDHVSAVNGRDWAALDAQCAEDMTLIDCRALRLWPDCRGRAQFVGMMRDLPTMAEDLQITCTVLESDDECGIVHYRMYGHAVEGGGELEYVSICLPVLRGAGLQGAGACYCEFFDEDTDLEILRARRDELRPLARRRPGMGLPDEPLPVERSCLKFWATMDDAGRTGEWQAFRELCAPDLDLIDHRHLAWGRMRGREPYIAAETTLAELAEPGLTRIYKLLAARGSIIAGVGHVRGTMRDGGGPFELHVAVVQQFCDEVLVHMQWFDPADQAALLGCFAELESTCQTTRPEDIQVRGPAADDEGA